MKNKVMQIGNVGGIISVVIFLLCTVWGAVLATAELKQFHMMLLQVLYPAYTATLGGVIIGLIEAYLYGWLLGAGAVWLHRAICK